MSPSALLVGVAAACLALGCGSAGSDIGASGFGSHSEDDSSDDEGDGDGDDTNPTSPSTTVLPPTTDPSTTDPTTDPTTAASSASDGDTTDDGGAEESTGSGAEESTETGDDGPPGASSGCGVTRFEPGTLLAVPVEVGDQERTFNIVIPNAHDGETPIPVVLAFHGWGLNPSVMAQMSQMTATAAQHGFVVAYGQGIGNSWNVGSCCGVAHEQQVDDVAFVRALIDNIGENLCVDLTRVYSTGFSNGGMLSHRLACEASDVIAAIAPVAGVIMLEDEQCTPPRPMPVMHFHGTGDTSVGYYGDGMVEHVSVAESTAGWVARNDCDPDPEITYMEDDTTCETWSNCGDSDAIVTLCSIDGMGHCWPGDPQCIGGNGDGVASTTLPASEAMAQFFAQYQLPQ